MQLVPLHVGISVNDLQEAIDWYGKNLGFYPDEPAPFRSGDSEIVFLRSGDFQIELFDGDHQVQTPAEYSANTCTGTKHIALGVPDMTALLAHLAQNGVVPVRQTSLGENWICFIQDNSGVTIELIEQGGKCNMPQK